MSSLEERLREIMAAKGWERRDLVRVTGQSSSVVSQWLGRGSKTIHTIQKIEAALALEKESGFAAAWIAKGLGPKRAAEAPDHGSAAWVAREPVAPFAGSSPLGVPEIVSALAGILDRLDTDRQGAVARALQALVVAPDSAKARAAVIRALEPPPEAG